MAIFRTRPSPSVLITFSIAVAIFSAFFIDISYALDFFAVEEFVTENIKANPDEDSSSHEENNESDGNAEGIEIPPLTILRQENGIFTTIDASDDNYIESVIVSISSDISDILEKHDTVEITLKGVNSTVSEDSIDNIDEDLIRYIILR